MLKLAKNIIIYVIVAILIVFYLFSFSFVFEKDYSYSYKTYYIDRKTKSWGGEDGLVVKMNEQYNFSNSEIAEHGEYTKGLQYLGRDFKYINITKNFRKILKEIHIDESATMYYQIDKNNLDSKYKIKIEVKCDENLVVNFKLNNQYIETNINDNVISAIINEAVEFNNLVIETNYEFQIEKLMFEEV